VLLIAGITSSAAAQSSDSGTRKHISVPSIEASPADVQSLDGIMKAYYEIACGPKGQPRQWARDRTLYIAGIRFVIMSDDAASGCPAVVLGRKTLVDCKRQHHLGKARSATAERISSLKRRYPNLASEVAALYTRRLLVTLPRTVAGSKNQTDSTFY
jgi:hypothetical protein